MPQPGKRWRHVTISTYASWLPGEQRGFRSKNHKIHSSGDYKHSPPPGEHAGLWRYAKGISGKPVVIPRACREVVARTLVDVLEEASHRVLIAAVAGMHSHLLVELPDDLREIRKIIGRAKSAASHAIRQRVPGRVWARDGHFKPVDTEQHHREAFGYILRQAGAWVWDFRVERPPPPPAQVRKASPAGVKHTHACRCGSANLSG